MRILVIYATKFGNTERVARAIAQGAEQVGPVRIVSVEAAPTALAERPDLLLVGGPTQRHGMSPELEGFLETLRPGSLQGIPTAAFDTRYQGSTLVYGSAASAAIKQLEKAGGRLVAPAESFFMNRGGPRSDRRSRPASSSTRRRGDTRLRQPSRHALRDWAEKPATGPPRVVR